MKPPHACRTTRSLAATVGVSAALAFPLLCAADGPADLPISELPVSKPYTGPLAKYDPDRELGLGEAVPEEPDKPLRRYLYLNMKDSSACPPIGTGDPHGIIVLDIDNGHRFVKRIGSEMMMHARCDPYSGPGVRWQHGCAKTDRLYYGYASPDRDFLKGINPATRPPDNANGVIGCIDLRTDETLWEQPTYAAASVAVSADGRTLLAAPHWGQSGVNTLTVMEADTGKIVETFPCRNGESHYISISRSGVLIPFRWRPSGTQIVFDPSTRKPVSMYEYFKIPPAFHQTLDQDRLISANGREDVLWGCTSSGLIIYRLEKGTMSRLRGYNAALFDNAASPLRSLPAGRRGPLRAYTPSLSPDERWMYFGPGRYDYRVVVFDNRDQEAWDPLPVGVMGENLSSTPQTDPISGETICCGNKTGAWISADGSVIHTSDSWHFCTRTWKPLGLLRNDEGTIIRCTKMNEVHFRGRDCVYFGQRFGYGRYKEPEKIFPPPTDKTPPAVIADLNAAIGEPHARWAGGAVVANVTLTWKPATDNEGVQRYAVYRDGTLIGNCLGVNPEIDPVMSPEDQAEYERQAGKFQPNTFVARYLAPGTNYTFEVEPIDFAQNRGPRTAVEVAIPAVDAAALESMSRHWAETVLLRMGQVGKRHKGSIAQSVFSVLKSYAHTDWGKVLLRSLRKQADWRLRPEIDKLAPPIKIKVPMTGVKLLDGTDGLDEEGFRLEE